MEEIDPVIQALELLFQSYTMEHFEKSVWFTDLWRQVQFFTEFGKQILGWYKIADFKYLN